MLLFVTLLPLIFHMAAAAGVPKSNGTSSASSPHMSSPTRPALLQPVSPTTSTVSGEDILSPWKGYVQWAEQIHKYGNESGLWTLQSPCNYSFFLWLEKIYLKESMKLNLYSVTDEGSNASLRTVHVWTPTRYTPRLTFVKGTVQLKLEAPKHVSYDLTYFQISYEPFPTNSLPQIVETAEAIGSSTSMLNCSAGNPVPAALVCDGVRHCVGDEDEADCEYRHQGCGDWVPYRDQCLKLFIVRKSGAVLKGHSYFTTPFRAQGVCGVSYGGATLPILPDEQGVQLAAKLIHQSGAAEVAVTLKKMRPVSKKLRHLYRFLWQWGTKGSPVDYEQTDIQRAGTMTDCAQLTIMPKVQFVPTRCSIQKKMMLSYACMRPNPRRAGGRQKPSASLTAATRQVHQFPTKQCADGSVVQVFHQCQWQGQVLSTQWSPNNFPLFQCQYGPPVHYTAVCDGLPDCADASDEDGCLFPQRLSKNGSLFVCDNHQVILQNRRCDGVADCFDDSDEQDCVRCEHNQCKGVGCVSALYSAYFDDCTMSQVSGSVTLDVSSSNFYVQLDGFGMSSINYVKESSPQPEGYFRCTSGIYIPSFLLNNGELDCPAGEDENIVHGNFTCPGFYRCQGYGSCVHADFVCDGVAHCPNKDDERYCGLAHPSGCTCEGHACSCHAAAMPRPLDHLAYLRYLDLSGGDKPVTAENLSVLEFLQFLNLSFCQLSNLTMAGMPQLRIVDLSYNALSGLSSLLMVGDLRGLTHLNLSGNPLVPTLDAAFSSFIIQAGLVRVQHLVLVKTGLKDINDDVLSVFSSMKSLDLRNNELEHYDRGIFRGLDSLSFLQTDDSRLCCSYFHPKPITCHAPINELSSCDNLLRTNFFRVFLWAGSLMTTLGNSAVLLNKLVLSRQRGVTPYLVLVSNLCAADLLMGVNMMIIGAADAYLRGNYVANERTWRRSSACVAAGFLAFLSSEVSALSICLVTLDRLLVLCFPLRVRLHVSVTSSVLLCCSAWTLGILLAAVPFIGQFEFYGESSICLPLPITRHQFSGQTYAFVVFIVLNFLLFLFIGTGQLAIYWAVHRARAAVNNPRQEEQTSIARRLFLVVFTDFCCWFPVGLMGILASAGVPIPGVVSVWAAVFVLPLNSALNPFLYTLNGLREKWYVRRAEQMSKRIFCNIQSKIPKLTPDTVEEIIMTYLRANNASQLRTVLKLMRCEQERENSAK